MTTLHFHCYNWIDFSKFKKVLINEKPQVLASRRSNLVDPTDTNNDDALTCSTSDDQEYAFYILINNFFVVLLL